MKSDEPGRGLRKELFKDASFSGEACQADKPPSKPNNMNFSELIHRMTGPDEERCIRFESAGGGHYIRHEEGEFSAVFAGPHGPENRPASINRENLERLFEEASSIDLVRTNESPFNHVAVRTSSSSESG